MFNYQKFLKRLKALRAEAGYTQKEVGEILDIGAPSYQRYENGSREPKLRAIYTLAVTYNVSADYLIGLSDVRRPNPLTETGKQHINTSSDSLNWDKLGRILTIDEKKRVFEALTGHDFPPYNEVEK